MYLRKSLAVTTAFLVEMKKHINLILHLYIHKVVWDFLFIMWECFQKRVLSENCSKLQLKFRGQQHGDT